MDGQVGDGDRGGSGLPSLGKETQLALFPEASARTADAVRATLEARLGAPVRIAVTRNRTSILTFKRAKSGAIEMRVHAAFLDAPDDVIDAIASFVERPARGAREKVAAYFQASGRAERRPARLPPPRASLRTSGRAHDLAQVFATLNARYFGGRLASRITWGSTRGAGAGPASLEEGSLDFELDGDMTLAAIPSGEARSPLVAARSGGGRGRTIRFGSYLADQDLIRVHPALDASWVPRYFLESIVYHEMLHAVIPVAREAGGRRCIHPPEFKKREREFHAFSEAMDWEKANLPKLLEAR